MASSCSACFAAVVSCHADEKERAGAAPTLAAREIAPLKTMWLPLKGIGTVSLFLGQQLFRLVF